MTKKKRSLRNEKLTVNRAPETEQRKERLRIEDKTRTLENRITRETAPVNSQKIEARRGQRET